MLRSDPEDCSYAEILEGVAFCTNASERAQATSVQHTVFQFLILLDVERVLLRSHANRVMSVSTCGTEKNQLNDSLLKALFKGLRQISHSQIRRLTRVP